MVNHSEKSPSLIDKRLDDHVVEFESFEAELIVLMNKLVDVVAVLRQM